MFNQLVTRLQADEGIMSAFLLDQDRENPVLPMSFYQFTLSRLLTPRDFACLLQEVVRDPNPPNQKWKWVQMPVQAKSERHKLKSKTALFKNLVCAR